MSLPRDQLRVLSCRSSRKLGQMGPDRLVSITGLVIGRQRLESPAA